MDITEMRGELKKFCYSVGGELSTNMCIYKTRRYDRLMDIMLEDNGKFSLNTSCGYFTVFPDRIKFEVYSAKPERPELILETKTSRIEINDTGFTLDSFNEG